MPKTCVICGVDCSGQPRVKDPRGHYYCRACYDQALRTRKASGAAAPPVVPASADEAPSFVEDFAASSMASSGPPPRVACPNCGHALNQDAVLCTRCGYRLDVAATLHTRAHMHGADSGGSEGSPWLWPVYLYFMPVRFFRMFAEDTPGVIAVIFFWLFGMAGVTDRLWTRQAMAQASGRPFLLPDRWSVHWAVVVLGGMLGGLIYAGIGGLWYRLRIRWSGHRDPDLHLARRVYVMASLVWAFPMLATMGYESLTYRTPGEAFQGNFHFLDGLVLLAAFGSLVTSFFGVCTVFEVRRWKVALWFLILPAFTQLIAVVVIIGAMVATAALSPAAVAAPQSFQSATLSFQYPGNWWIDDLDPAFDSDTFVGVEPPQDAYLLIQIYDTADTAETELERSLQDLDATFPGLRPSRSFAHWGSVAGVGQTVRGIVEGEEVVFSIFVTPLGDGSVLEVQETCSLAHFSMVQPGFDLIRRTFMVH